MKANKNSGPAKHGRSIDGIISSNPTLGEVKDSHELNKAETGLGTINRAEDGFHPVRSGSGSVGVMAVSPAAAAYEPLDEPILLDDIEPRRRSKKHKHPRFRKWFKRGSLILLALIIAGGVFFGLKFYKTSKHFLAGGGQAPAVCDGDVPVKNLNSEGDSRVNVLLLGIGGEGHDAPDLTDTIMIASLDPVNDKLDLLSLPRDLFVKIPGVGSRKINEAYYWGKTNSTSKDPLQQQRDGIKLADQTISNVLGIKIHYHGVVNFQAFQDAVNALGGVDANVPKELTAHEVFWVEGSRPAKYYTLDVKAVQTHFDGTKALYFARERHNDSDFVRGQRQRLMLAAIKEKALSVGTLSNPIKISNLMSSLGNNVYTDFDTGSIKCLSTQISQVPSSSINSLDLVTAPHDFLTTSALSGSTVSPKAGTYAYGAIQDYVHATLRDSFIARENSSVAVYNATTAAGLATTQAALLKTYGYNVTTVDNSPTQNNPLTTTVVDLSGGADKYTKHYLETRYKTKAVSNLPSNYGISPAQGTKFVIILGKDSSNSTTH
jgi:LCP family protein required for cell wall assembly